MTIVAERFESSPILLRPQSGGEVSIESGGEALAVQGGGTAEGEKADRPSRPTVPPGWEVLMLSDGETISTTHGLEGEEEVDLGAWVEGHGTADKLKVYAATTALNTGDLAPLVAVAQRHQIDIDIHLRDDG